MVLPIISNEQCEDVYGKDLVKEEKNCTGGTNGHGTCNGDSGGPLAVKIDVEQFW